MHDGGAKEKVRRQEGYDVAWLQVQHEFIVDSTIYNSERKFMAVWETIDLRCVWIELLHIPIYVGLWVSVFPYIYLLISPNSNFTK